MSEYWKPMENAPRDGSPIYLKVNDQAGDYQISWPCKYDPPEEKGNPVVGGGWVNAVSLTPIKPRPVAWRKTRKGIRG